MPALLTTMSRPPNTSTARAVAASQSASLVTSWRKNAALPPASVISLTAASPASPAMSVMRTAAPSLASRWAVALPIPLAAPVMRATRPSSLFMMHSFVSVPR